MTSKRSSRWVGALMAGGVSRRMGQDKLRMKLRTGERLIDLPAAALRAHCQHLYCIGPDLGKLPELIGFQPLADSIAQKAPAGSGPIAGLVAALEKAKQIPSARWVLALAGDLPLVQAQHLEDLILQAESQPEVAVVPVNEHGLEPLLAAYPVGFATAARNYLESGRRSLKGFLAEQPWTALSGAGSDTIQSCFNLNRPEDWERLPGPADQDH